MKIITLIVSLICIIVTILAFFWEFRDYLRLQRKKCVYDIKDPDEKEKEYIFYSTFNYENFIVWRSIFIQSGISTLLIVFVMKTFGMKIQISHAIIFLFIIFLVFYFGANFKNFHLWRVMASKIKPDIAIL